MQSKRAAEMPDLDDFDIDFDCESGFDPDAYGGGGGVELKALQSSLRPVSSNLSSVVLANDGVQLDAWSAEKESDMLLTPANDAHTNSGERQAGLVQIHMAQKHGESSCINMLLLLAAWLLVGIVIALSQSLSPAFPRTPPNQDMTDVPLMLLRPAEWVAGRNSKQTAGGDVLEDVKEVNTSSFAALGGGAWGYEQWIDAANGAESEAVYGEIEGSVDAGSWQFYKYRLDGLNMSLDGAFHLRVPTLRNMLHPNHSDGACAGLYFFLSFFLLTSKRK